MAQYVVHKGVYCQVSEVGWRVKKWHSPVTGQGEFMAWRRKVYVPLGDYDDPLLRPFEVDQSGTELEKEQEEARRLRALAKSAARAKRVCRHKIKSASFGSLLTCTYRENMTDFERVRADWASLLRKLQRVIPGFRAVYAFEPQERGAWHVHAAIDKLPPWITFTEKVKASGAAGARYESRVCRVRSWDYVRRLWLGIVGAGNGNIDVDGHRKTRHGLPGKYRAAESLAKLAGYISKYLTKDHANGIPGRNRWGSTQGLEASKGVVFDMPEMSLGALVGLAFELPDGHRIVRHQVGQFGKFWVLYTEPSEGDLRPLVGPDAYV